MSVTVASTSASANTITGAHIALPTPMQVIAPRASFPVDMVDPRDAFFGYTLSGTHTRESRHDAGLDVPPPYVEEPELPAYSRFAEPATLAMYLFKFGFLFPPFWIFGALILLSPLREPPSSSGSAAWLPDKTEAERQQIIDNMRTVELKWARRCLYALFCLILVGTAAGVGAWVVLRS